MALEGLLNEAKKIKGVLEGKREYKRAGYWLNYFVLSGHAVENGAIKEGNYFGIEYSLPEIISLQSRLEMNQLVEYYKITLHSDNDKGPIFILLSDLQGYAAYKIVRTERFFGVRYKIIEKGH